MLPHLCQVKFRSELTRAALLNTALAVCRPLELSSDKLLFVVKLLRQAIGRNFSGFSIAGKFDYLHLAAGLEVLYYVHPWQDKLRIQQSSQTAKSAIA